MAGIYGHCKTSASFASEETRSVRDPLATCQESGRPVAWIPGVRALSGRRGSRSGPANRTDQGAPGPRLHPVRRQPPLPGDLAVPVREHSGASEQGGAAGIQDAHPRRAGQGGSIPLSIAAPASSKEAGVLQSP